MNEDQKYLSEIREATRDFQVAFNDLRQKWNKLRRMVDLQGVKVEPPEPIQPQADQEIF